MCLPVRSHWSDILFSSLSLEFKTSLRTALRNLTCIPTVSEIARLRTHCFNAKCADSTYLAVYAILSSMPPLLFKIQVKKLENGRREDPVIFGTGNLTTIPSRVNIIFIFDLKSFSNLKTISSHAISNGLLHVSELTPHSARLANGKLFLHRLIFF